MRSALSLCLFLVALQFLFFSSCNRLRHQDLTLGEVPALPGGCQAASCHGKTPLMVYPPTSGSHTAHLESLSPGGTDNSCSLCHWDYSFNGQHRNSQMEGYDARTLSQHRGNIVFFGGIFQNEWVSGRYNTVADKCSRVSCHDTGPGAIVWYGEGGHCIICHQPGNTFPRAPDPYLSGSHIRHVVTENLGCETCHNNYLTDPLHDDGILQTASISTQMVKPDPVINPNGVYDPATGKCDNVYCHGNSSGDWSRFDFGAVSANLPPSPVWGAAGSVKCGSCHDVGDSTAVPADQLLSGSHAKHMGNNPAGALYGYSCSRCHSTSVAADNTTLLGDHANGRIDIRLDDSSPDFSYNTGNNRCSNAYCHGAFPGGNTANTADWNQPPTAVCGSCHELAPANAQNGSHDLHTDASGYHLACENCHDGIASGVEGSVVFGASPFPDHADFTVDVSFGSLADQGPGTAALYSGNNQPPGSGGSCSYTYCHGDFRAADNTYWPEGNDGSGGKANNRPLWSATATAPCGSCHGVTSGVNAGLGIPNANNVWHTVGDAHPKHAGSASAEGYQYPCGYCHYGVYDAVMADVDGGGYNQGDPFESGAKVPSFTLHSNGVREIAFFTDFTGTSAVYLPGSNPQEVACSNLYCHSDGWDRSRRQRDEVGSPGSHLAAGATVSWNESADCTSCHNRGAGNPAPRHNDHDGQNHYNPDGAGRHETSCAHCHATTTTASGETKLDNVIRYADRRHVNRYINVQFGLHTADTSQSRSYSRSDGTCYVECHTTGGTSRNHNPQNDWYHLTDSPSPIPSGILAEENP